MGIFVHTGVTVIAAVVINTIFNKKPTETIDDIQTVPSENPSRGSLVYILSDFMNRLWQSLSRLGKYVDIRILVVGSLLPDIIDKPVGIFLFGNTFANGRIFAHTLLFLVFIAVTGFYLYKKSKKNWLLVLSFGIFTHLILDTMWTQPRTLFWPLFGFSFDRTTDAFLWLERVFSELIHNPAIFLPEIIGLLIIVWFIWQLIRRGSLVSFLKYGALTRT